MARTMDDWVARLEAENVPCGPIYDLKQVFEHEQVKFRGLKQLVPHAAGVDAPTVASPMNLSDTPIQHTRSSPALGEHNSEVLQGILGLDADALEGLRKKGIT